MSDRKAPPGVIALFTDETGHVVATVTDFHRGGIGGCTLRETQEYRAKTALAHEMVNRYASRQLVRAMEDWRCREIMDRLCREFGCKVQIIPIGHADE
jgi:hypothetical protein